MADDDRVAVAKVLLRWHYGPGVDIEHEWRRRSDDGREHWLKRADEVVAPARTAGYRQAIADLRDTDAWREWIIAQEEALYDGDNLFAADFLESRLTEGSDSG